MTDIVDSFRELSTAPIFDAAVRLNLPTRLAPQMVQSVVVGSRTAGPALPVRHYGSVDVFLEAMSSSHKGDVLVIDNGGRIDEACIGDLTVLEAQAARLAGIVVWGCHRDTAELRRVPVPVFSCGRNPAGPTKLRPRPRNALTTASFGRFKVTRDDVVFGDDDGVLFIQKKHLKPLLKTARAIARTERRQAAGVRRGETLREQLRFKEYLERRSRNSSYTFREHLREIGGAIEV